MASWLATSVIHDKTWLKPAHIWSTLAGKRQEWWKKAKQYSVVVGAVTQLNFKALMLHYDAKPIISNWRLSCCCWPKKALILDQRSNWYLALAQILCMTCLFGPGCLLMGCWGARGQFSHSSSLGVGPCLTVKSSVSLTCTCCSDLFFL